MNAIITDDGENYEGPSSISTSSSGSPFRQERFANKTRRQALQQLLEKKSTIRSPPKEIGNSSGDEVEKTSSCARTASTALSTTEDPVERDEIDGPPDCHRNLPQHMEEDVAPQPPSPSSEIYYYRVVYRGVVALVLEPDSTSTKSGAYVSYGDIFESRYQLDVEEMECMAPDSVGSPTQQKAIYNTLQVFDGAPDSPPRTVLSNAGESEVSSLDTLPTVSSTGGQKQCQHGYSQQKNPVWKQAVRVDRVLTGGYAMDGTEANSTCSEREILQVGTPKRSNALQSMISPLPLDNAFRKNSSSRSTAEEGSHGFIMSSQKNIPLIECIPKPPKMKTGNFLYRIVSPAPVPIFTASCSHAPVTKAVLLPGSTHKICLELQQEDHTFLRLSHRRGWICEQKVSLASNGTVTIGSSKAVQHVLSDQSMMRPARIRHRPPRRKRESQAASQVVTPDPSFLASPNVSMLSEDDGEYAVVSPVNLKTHNTPDRSIARSQILYGTSRCIEKPAAFVYKVNAPRGLKILDAPHFQVSTLIRGGGGGGNIKRSGGTSVSTGPNSTPKVRNSSGDSTFQAIGGYQTPISRICNPAIFDAIKKQRILPRGVIFEASRRIEKSSSLIQGGAGLIKLLDNSGWAIVPGQEELDIQYRNFHGGMANVREGEATLAVEEVGNALINIDSSGTEEDADCIWVRAISRQGMQVECQPPSLSVPLEDQQPGRDASPTSSTGESSTSEGGSTFGALTSHDSDVASSVGSAFLDAMFRTPKRGSHDNDVSLKQSNKKPPYPFYTTGPSSTSDITRIPCGMYFQINKWDDSVLSASAQRFVRIRGCQGWVPRSVVGKPVIERISPPEIRIGSFWFRVLARKGIKVRRGPSQRAIAIKSEDDIHFRFETGEFLRASEVVTFFPEQCPPETFAKLYRNRHVRLNEAEVDHRQLQSIACPAEWVQITGDDCKYLEEYKSEPQIERHRGGWRYNAVCEDGIHIRKGPSFVAASTGLKLLAGESVLITERVSPPGERITWLRLKDGKGWVHDIDQKDEAIMIPHSLLDRKHILQAPLKAEQEGKTDVAYNTIIARLFPSSNDSSRSGERE